MTLVDSHCHLDFPDFAPELDAVIARARTAGVTVMQTICTRLTEFDRVRAIAEAHEGVYCSVGVHPHHVAEEPVVDAPSLIALTDDPRVIGIGETGLDYYYDNSPREAQRESFSAHISAARATGLPVIVHTRAADEDTAKILADEIRVGTFPGVIHCFSTSRELAETALSLGFYISLSGILTFKKAETLRAIVEDLPLDRLLVETDAPYLAPVPNRGKRNEPAFVTHTVECIAALRGMTPDEVGCLTTANFFTLFNKASRGA